jgi:prepilin-type N-terminal cleavage/methylation domain-containing protein
MRCAFTLIELMIVISIIAIISAIAIPEIVKRNTKPGEVYVTYSEIVGKTFPWNGNKIVVSSWGDNGTYGIVILPTNPNQSPVSVNADRGIILEAYKESLRKPEKVEQ